MVIEPSSVNYRSPPDGKGRRPHVCMIVHAHYPVGEPRGEREARAAVDAGYNVSVVCLRASHERPTEIVNDVGVIRLPIEHVRGVGALRSVLEYVRFAVRAAVATFKIHRRTPIDVVYVHAPPDFLIVAALLPRLFGSSVVLDIHDLSPHMVEARFGDSRLSVLAQRALRGVERTACAVADQVITVHGPYRDELMANRVPPDKISVVMNGPMTEAVESARATAAGPQRDTDSFLVAYHGTVTRWYGVDLVIEAIGLLEDRIPELHALIVGEGDALPSLDALIRRLRVESRVELSRAYVSHFEALRQVAFANCGVIPNRRSRLNRFALSSKLLDYVALGVPVVVARLETLAAHFTPDEVTFFEPDDPESLAEAIASVAEHPINARKKAERARRRAESYSWRTSRTRLLEVLSDVASDARQ